MFDIGFTELLLIGIVSLIVLGPERLPHAARMTGAWIAKIRRTFLSLQVEIEQEVNAQDIRNRLEKEAEATGIKDIEQEFKSAITDATSLNNADLDKTAQEKTHPSNDTPETSQANISQGRDSHHINDHHINDEECHQHHKKTALEVENTLSQKKNT
jgi:sec-independent protein translocase protein TatB